MSLRLNVIWKRRNGKFQCSQIVVNSSEIDRNQQESPEFDKHLNLLYIKR